MKEQKKQTKKRKKRDLATNLTCARDRQPEVAGGVRKRGVDGVRNGRRCPRVKGQVREKVRMERRGKAKDKRQRERRATVKLVQGRKKKKTRQLVQASPN